MSPQTAHSWDGACRSLPAWRSALAGELAAEFGAELSWSGWAWVWVCLWPSVILANLGLCAEELAGETVRCTGSEALRTGGGPPSEGDPPEEMVAAAAASTAAVAAANSEIVGKVGSE